MADSSHLEKMGRELKCPICLSLLNSAVSLTCNHVFCHSCIHKSMRSSSNCPVCKVPYQRREVRPAPHMDNLVNIYKSMEVASGLSLFVSQKAPATKMADAEILANGELDKGRKTAEEISDTANCKRVKGVSSTEAKLKRKSSGRARRKSSFATNKRVQVPQSPITETPVRKGKDEHNGNTVTINPLNKCSAIAHEHLLSTNQESSHLSPFFWVREVERPSQQTDVEPLTGTPLKAPSFSDLKDSDDEVPPEVSEVPHSKCNADFFDSEMFEWTQRACSPELCSNPVENQVDDTEDDIMLGQKSVEVSRDACKNGIMIIEQPANASPQKNMDNELHNNGYPGRNIEDSISAPRFTCNKGVNERKESQKTFKRFKTKTQESNDCLKTPSDFMQCLGPDNEVLGTSKVFGTSETRHVQSLHPRLSNEGDIHVPELPVPQESREANHKDKKLGNSKREFNSIGHNHESVPLKRKKQVKNSTCIIGGKSNSLKELLVDIPNKDVSKSKSCSTSKPQEICELTSVFQQMVSLNGISKKNMTDEGENVQQKSIHNVKRSLEKGKSNQQNNMPALRKCNTDGIKCAFCHSMEETKDSGQIVHYSEGKPVLATHTGASVIHSHRSCTEWAPNVYFKDEIVVNLEEELTRSRRIKCSLCGVKGAALGCYEKSCRKSFHVPCAKKLKECRWDTDHFVILCPLHASLKLPSEMLTQEVRKGKCDYKGRQRSEVAVRQSAVRQSHSLNKWFCGPPSEKIVICCSGLATADKEAVSELAKSAGVVVLGSWNASVTHVIASTNEDGACKRTLKVLMGILEGKWVLNIKWVQACMETKKLVEEAPYEITCIHGYENGPRLGRLRLLNQQPKLFSGFKFYFVGEFEPSYKGYLQDLVTTAGGTVLHRKPIRESNGTGMPSSSTVIVYSIELHGNCDRHKKDMLLNQRRYNAQALANTSGAKIASNSWILDSITGHKLQDL